MPPQGAKLGGAQRAVRRQTQFHEAFQPAPFPWARIVRRVGHPAEFILFAIALLKTFTPRGVISCTEQKRSWAAGEYRLEVSNLRLAVASIPGILILAHRRADIFAEHAPHCRDGIGHGFG